VNEKHGRVEAERRQREKAEWLRREEAERLAREASGMPAPQEAPKAPRQLDPLEMAAIVYTEDHMKKRHPREPDPPGFVFPPTPAEKVGAWFRRTILRKRER
jgi:hypothetical protein